MSRSKFHRGDRQSVARATSGLCAVCAAPAPYLIERSQQWVCHRHLEGFINWPEREKVATAPTLGELQALAADAPQIAQAA